MFSIDIVMRQSPLQIKSSIKLLKDQPPNTVETLLNALRYALYELPHMHNDNNMTITLCSVKAVAMLNNLLCQPNEQ